MTTRVREPSAFTLAWEFSASGPEETGIVFHAMSSAIEKMFVACTFSELADTLLSVPLKVIYRKLMVRGDLLSLDDSSFPPSP
jgi:hypothetical protein